MAKWKTGRSAGSFARRSGKPSGLPGLSRGEVANCQGRGDFSTAKWESGGRAHFRTAKRRSLRGRGLSHGEAANWGPAPLRAYKRKGKPQAAKGDGTANFVTKGRQGCRRLDAGSSPNGIRNVAGKTWLFAPKRAKLAVPKGKRPKGPPKPHPSPQRGFPPRPPDPTCAASAKRATGLPPQSDRSRGLSGCPLRPNLSAWRRAESPKRKRKEEPTMPRPPPLCPRWVSHPNSA